MEITFYDIVIYLGILGLLMMIFSFLTGMRYIKIHYCPIKIKKIFFRTVWY